jgi:hypothetical protein
MYLLEAFWYVAAYASIHFLNDRVTWNDGWDDLVFVDIFAPSILERNLGCLNLWYFVQMHRKYKRQIF